MRILIWPIVIVFSVLHVHSQGRNSYAGFLGGVSTLSADGRTDIDSSPARVAIYDPKNGQSISGFGGRYFGNYLAIQVSYIWNRNQLTLTQIASMGPAESISVQTRESRRHQAALDLLIYFREKPSAVRPYLSFGVGLRGLNSTFRHFTIQRNATLTPPLAFSKTDPVARFAVGMDVKVQRDWRLRYTFVETIGTNAVNRLLEPRPSRNLMTFYNLFGLFRVF